MSARRSARPRQEGEGARGVGRPFVLAGGAGDIGSDWSDPGDVAETAHVAGEAPLSPTSTVERARQGPNGGPKATRPPQRGHARTAKEGETGRPGCPQLNRPGSDGDSVVWVSHATLG